MNLPRVSLILGIFVAIATLAGTTWAAADYLRVRPAFINEVDAVTELAALNQRDIMIMRFDQLNRKKNSVGLTPIEFQIWCELGTKLGYVSNCNA